MVVIYKKITNGILQVLPDNEALCVKCSLKILHYGFFACFFKLCGKLFDEVEF